MNLAIIGAGRLGSALASRLSKAGHAVFLGGNDPESLRQAAKGLPDTRYGTNAQAAEFGDVVVLAVPFAAISAAIAATERQLSGKIVWSCVNALKPDFSGLAVGFDTSAGELVAKRVHEAADNARVVAALPPFAELLASGESDFAGQRPSVFVCGDDAKAKHQVSELVNDLGADAVDAGALSSSRLVEPAMMLLVGLTYATDPPGTLALKLLRKQACCGNRLRWRPTDIRSALAAPRLTGMTRS